MKKKFLISGGVLFVTVLIIALFLVLNKDGEENKIELKDYSFVNVESLKTSDVDILEVDDFTVKNVRIKNGYLEGVFLTNSEESYEVLDIVINIYDEDSKKLDEINFEFNNVLPYEERDLFYPIQKDLSKSYYISVEER